MSESTQTDDRDETPTATASPSNSDGHAEGVPSNAELAQQVARMEENVEHVAETVDRIDDRLGDQQAALAEDLDQTSDRTDFLWTRYRVGSTVVKWGIPTVGTLVGGLAAAGVV